MRGGPQPPEAPIPRRRELMNSGSRTGAPRLLEPQEKTRPASALRGCDRGPKPLPEDPGTQTADLGLRRPRPVGDPAPLGGKAGTGETAVGSWPGCALSASLALPSSPAPLSQTSSEPLCVRGTEWGALGA